MPYITVKNQSGFDIGFLKKFAKKLEPYLELVDPSKYPFKVIVTRKKDFYDRSSFDLMSNQLNLKIDLAKQSPEEIAWVLAHEFAHFLCNNNEELKKTCLGNEHEHLERMISQKYSIEVDKVHEIFHDFLPAEVFANGFATMVIGKFYKRHPYKNVKNFLRENGQKKNYKKDFKG